MAHAMPFARPAPSAFRKVLDFVQDSCPTARQYNFKVRASAWAV